MSRADAQGLRPQTQATPAISVIVPLYNVEPYVEGLVETLKRQTFGDFEVVMVDDGSTDNTFARMSAATADDARFTIERQENAGPATARNRALDRARGTYVAFLDADDGLAANAFARLYETAETQALDYLDFNAHTEYEDPKLRAVRDESFYEGRADIPGVMTGPELFCAFQRRSEYCCALWLHFVRRDLIEGARLRLRDGMYVHEDELFSPLLVAHAKRAAFLNEPLYLRRVRTASAMTSGRGMRNVESMFAAAQGLASWLAVHVRDLDAPFAGALAQRISELYQLAAADAASVDADDLVAFAQTLDGQERVDFEVNVVQASILRSEFYASTTWRVGQAVLAVPQALRDLATSRQATQARGEIEDVTL